jgi:hypothetical protein
MIEYTLKLSPGCQICSKGEQMNPLLLLGALILIGIILDWWDDNQQKAHDWLMDFEGAIAKYLGYVVVDHFVEWNDWSFREREVLPKGSTEDAIREANRLHAHKFIKEHKLESTPGVTWRWKRV